MHYISQIAQLLSKGILSKSDILDLLSKIRIVIEKEESQLTYPVLKLYCDWALHPHIDRSELGFNILEKISIMIYDFDNKKFHTEKVQEYISIPEFRKEMIHFLNSKSLDFSFLLDDKIWKEFFIVILLNHLIEKPIRLPYLNSKGKKNSKYEQKFNQILLKVGGKKLYVVREFSFCIYDKKVHWKLLTDNDFINIISPMALD